jgi:branched-chain amino acid transport system substrate-binding protein
VPTAGWTGPVFGSSEDYNRLFRERYGRDASFFSAQPSAAGVILQLAIEKAGTLDPDKVRQILSKTDVEIFYNQIKYDERGFNIGGIGLIGQVQQGKPLIVWPTNRRQADLRPKPPWGTKP